MGLGYVKSQRHAANDRRIIENLRRLAEFTKQYETQGMSREEADRKAFQMVKAGAKPLEDGPCSHCGATDETEATFKCPIAFAPKRACHGEAP